MSQIQLQKIKNLLNRKEKKRFSILVGQMILVALLEFLGIALVLPFIKLAGDQFDMNVLPSFVSEFVIDFSKQDLLVYSGLIIFFLIVLSTVLKIYLSWREQSFVWDVSHKMGIEQHKNILAKPYTFFIEKNSSEIITNLIVETSTVVRGILLPFAQIISNSIVATLFLALITILHPKISLIFICVSFALGFVLVLLLKTKLEALGSKRVRLERSRYSRLKESIIGIKTIKSSQKEDYFLKGFEQTSLDYSFIKPVVNTINAIPRKALDIVLFGGVILFVTLLLLNGHDVAGVLPSLTFYVFVGFKLLPTFQNIINGIITIRFSWPSIIPVLQGLKKEIVDEPSNYHDESVKFSDKLVLSDCFFAHQAHDYILKDVSIEIPKGQKIGIVGYSGSGKTTLVEILSGLLSPNKGDLLVDQTKITPENRLGLMNLIAFIPQDVFFFDDTILNNITLEADGKKLDQEKLDEILDVLALSEFIDTLPEGLATRVGEHGVKLSGGQKQRFGFARALYRDPEILILDESTSAMDYVTEKELLLNLRSQKEDLTIIKVAHRLKSVEDCEKLYFLDQGEIIASGTFEQVVQNNNLFKEMVRAGTI